MEINTRKYQQLPNVVDWDILYQRQYSVFKYFQPKQPKNTRGHKKDVVSYSLSTQMGAQKLRRNMPNQKTKDRFELKVYRLQISDFQEATCDMAV